MRVHVLNAKIDHVAIAVHDIRASMSMFCDALGGTFLFAGDQIDQGFRFAQFQFPHGGKIELVTPLGKGFVQRFLDSRGEGVHHITWKTPDIESSIKHLEGLGVRLINVSTDREQWKEAFIHPKDAHGVLVQIAQSSWEDEEMARHHLSDHSNAGHRHVLHADL
ncbi:MAG: VOC family protein [Actinomycetota bacterium]